MAHRYELERAELLQALDDIDYVLWAVYDKMPKRKYERLERSINDLAEIVRTAEWLPRFRLRPLPRSTTKLVTIKR